MKFTEEKLEQSFIELLGNEGFPHLSGNNIFRSDDEVLIGRGNYLDSMLYIGKNTDRSIK